MQKLNVPIKRSRKKYMILYQTEINNFCKNDLFHEKNRKLHSRGGTPIHYLYRFEAPDLERDTHFRGVFYNGV